MNTLLEDVLRGDPLRRQYEKTISTKLQCRSSFRLLPSGGDRNSLLVRFASQRPWRYWDDQTVTRALSLLEKNADRTIEAIGVRAFPLGIGFENLLRKGPLDDIEESFSVQDSRELLQLSTRFNPEYLRRTEHIFGNLLSIYWSVTKKGSTEGHFDLKGATDQMRQRGDDLLLQGYDERIRNAIAHGQCVFTGTGIRYGSHSKREYPASEFLRAYDELARTCNALAVALLLFVLRNLRAIRESQVLPISIITALAGGEVERPGFSVGGSVESESLSSERQLHIAVKTSYRNRIIVMWDCARLALHLVEGGALRYDRFLFGIDQGEAIESLLVILPKKLANLLSRDAQQERLPEVFQEVPLLWFHEGVWRNRLRAWKHILGGAWQEFKEATVAEWSRAGLLSAAGSFRVRKVKNVSTQGLARIHVYAVLNTPEDGNDREKVRAIVRRIVKTTRRRRVNSRPSSLDGGLPWRKKPSYVFLYLFRNDGPVRWLQGWKNTVAVAEWIRGRKSPVLVKNPQEIVSGIRLRYELDRQEIFELATRLNQLLANVKNRAGK